MRVQELRSRWILAELTTIVSLSRASNATNVPSKVFTCIYGELHKSATKLDACMSGREVPPKSGNALRGAAQPRGPTWLL